MMVIADSGSTKTAWRVVRDEQSIIPYSTTGFNPVTASTELIAKEMQLVFKETFFLAKVTTVYYYGAGCWDNASCTIVEKALRRVFPNAVIAVTNDLIAAARATCGTRPGIVGILGTGSNSCLYDGEKIKDNVTSLGYIIGDEGSGTHLGKNLLKSYFYRELPPVLEKKLEAQYTISKKKLIERVYFKKGGNTYLAAFAKFIIQEKEHPFIKKIVEEALETFVKRHLLKYENTRNLPIHFVGSIAFFLKEILKEVLELNNLKIGNIIQQPIEGLIRYHLEN